MSRLEHEAWIASREAGITDSTWQKFMAKLAPLKGHHHGMYEHSLRVGLYAFGIAAHEGWPDTALPLLGGCGHDVGKLYVPCSILDATGKLTEAEWACIQRHPEDTWRILRDDFPLSAMVGGLHHTFGPRHYGISIGDKPEWMPDGVTTKVLAATDLVVISDFYDAITTRSNDSTQVDPHDADAVRTLLGEHFGDWPERVAWLSANLI